MPHAYSFARRAALALALISLSQCTLRDRVTEAPTPTLKFRLVRIEEATLGGLDARNWREPADVSLAQRSQLIQGYVSKDLPLRMRLQLEVRDPSQLTGTLTAFDYEVFIDDKLLGSGQAAPGLALPADGRGAPVELAFAFNTRKLLGDDALPALRNFALGLADPRRRPPRLGLRLRPTLLGVDGNTWVVKNYLLVSTDSMATAAARPAPRTDSLPAPARALPPATE